MLQINQRSNNCYTLQEFCNKYQCSERTVYRLVENGTVKKLIHPLTKRVYFKPTKQIGSITIKQACYLLNIGRTTLYRYIKKGIIVPVSTSPRITFSEESIKAFEWSED